MNRVHLFWLIALLAICAFAVSLVSLKKYGNISGLRSLASEVGSLQPYTGSQYECDVWPRDTGGDGKVTEDDWKQVGNFSVRLDIPVPGIEFQKADCSPYNTKGDGRILTSDWVTAGRVSKGLEALQIVGGPDHPITFVASITPTTVKQGESYTLTAKFIHRQTINSPDNSEKPYEGLLKYRQRLCRLDKPLDCNDWTDQTFLQPLVNGQLVTDIFSNAIYPLGIYELYFSSANPGQEGWGGQSQKLTLRVEPSSLFICPANYHFHPADTNKDCKIGISEITAFYALAGNAADIWRKGEKYYWDESTQTWKPRQ